MVRCTRAHRPPSHISKMVLSTVHVGGLVSVGDMCQTWTGDHHSGVRQLKSPEQR